MFLRRAPIDLFSGRDILLAELKKTGRRGTGGNAGELGVGLGAWRRLGLYMPDIQPYKTSPVVGLGVGHNKSLLAPYQFYLYKQPRPTLHEGYVSINLFMILGEQILDLHLTINYSFQERIKKAFVFQVQNHGTT